MEPDLQTTEANIEPGSAYPKDAQLPPAAVEALNRRSLAELEELAAEANKPDR
jgi:hypothetical protein